MDSASEELGMGDAETTQVRALSAGDPPRRVLRHFVDGRMQNQEVHHHLG